MKNADDAIDRALAALNATEAPAGLEHRVLREVQDHGSDRPALRGRWRRKLLQASGPISRPTQVWVWGSLWASAGLVAAMLLIAPVRSLHHGSSHLAALVVQRAAPQAAPLIQPAKLPAVALPAEHGRPLVSRTVRTQGPPAASVATSQDSMAALAWSETRAPSRPAPPLPLTDQEKLFQRIVHRGDPVELAALDPAARDAVAAREHADFRAFFKSSPQENTPESH